MADVDDVRRIALSFPATTQSGSGFGVNEKGFAWFYQEKVEGQRGRVERRDVLAVRVPNLWEKDALIASDAEKFFTTAHYNGYPAILVRLPAIGTDELTELLTEAWRSRAPRPLVRAFDAEVNAAKKPAMDP